MAADIIPLRSSRSELVRERARQIVKGEIRPFETGIGRGFGLNLETYRCGLCDGRFAPVGWAWFWYEDEPMVVVHKGCGKEAENWAYDPEQDDYPGGSAA